MDRRRTNTNKMVLTALLTAVVIILQMLGTFVRFGPFSISLVLMPIAIGAALSGIVAGAWLGLVFGIVVLIQGDANLFIAINPAGAVFIVLLKGALAGGVAGAVYKALESLSRTIGAIAAAVMCPIVNTGIFICGAYVFFLGTLEEWGAAAGFLNVTAFIFVSLIGINFLIELGINVILCPVIIRLIQYGQRTMKKAA